MNPALKLEAGAAEARPRLLGLARKLFSNRPDIDAEDVVQDVLASVFANPDLAETVADLSAYLFRALRNRIIDRQRAKKEVVSISAGLEGAPHDLTDNRMGSAERIARDHLFTALDAALLSLEAEDRELVTRIELGGETHEALATEKKIPLGTVLSKKNRALRRLRSELELMGYEWPLARE